MKKLLITLFTLLLSLNIYSQVKKTSIPKWVKNIEYNSNPNINESYINQGLLFLLSDQQINENSKSYFFRSVSKIIDNAGIQAGSSISVLFDPSYQKLEFHKINIIRDGKTIKKLKNSDFQLIRRELNAESYIYDGSLSAVSNLSDVRSDDIIDYSYTIKGINPVHKGKFSTSFYLNSTEPIGKINISILSKKDLVFKYVNTDLKVRKTQQKGMNRYSFSEEDIEAYEYINNTPSWILQLSSVFVSEYKSWGEVVNWGVDLFKVNQKLSKDLRKKIQEIDSKYKTSGGKINATLDFVQDEVRYLGLESGIGAYKPSSPNKVFTQRFGDCKDKSLLMVTMLNEMGIEAYPMLVNTYLKKTITDLTPTPTMFDHCVVKVQDKREGDLWYDPTISNQGGTYSETFFPDYKYGLVLKKGNIEFDETYSLTNDSVEISDNYFLEDVGKGATLKTTTVYSDSQADYMRNYYLDNSINSIKKEYESYYSKYFYNIKSIENPKFKDDKEKNIFTTYENYKIDSIWSPSIDGKQLNSSFYSYGISNTLSMPAKRERNRPYALYSTGSKTHEINIKLPEKWNIQKESYDISSPSFYYTFDVRYKEDYNMLKISHFLKIQKDYVDTNEFNSFYDNVKKIDNNIVYSLMIPKNYKNSSFGNNTDSNWLSYLGQFLFIISILLFVWIAYKLYIYDPEPKIESYFENDKKIGGWLVLIGIGLCFSPFMIIYNYLFSDHVMFLNGSWTVFFDSTSGYYNFSLGVAVFFEMLFNSFILVINPLLIYLFFKRRSSFPKLYSFVLIGILIFMLLDNLLVNYLSNTNLEQSEITELLKMFIRTSIIASYLLASERVKETFVKRKI